MKTEMEKLCTRDNVTADFRWGEAKGDGWDNACNNWRVTLKRHGRQLSVDFFGGSAVTNPSAADVLSCLVSDVRIHENDEYDDLGFSGSEAIRVYKLLEKLSPKIRRFLGDDFDEYAEAEH